MYVSIHLVCDLFRVDQLIRCNCRVHVESCGCYVNTGNNKCSAVQAKRHTNTQRVEGEWKKQTLSRTRRASHVWREREREETWDRREETNKLQEWRYGDVAWWWYRGWTLVIDWVTRVMDIKFHLMVSRMQHEQQEEQRQWETERQHVTLKSIWIHLFYLDAAFESSLQMWVSRDCLFSALQWQWCEVHEQSNLESCALSTTYASHPRFPKTHRWVERREERESGGRDEIKQEINDDINDEIFSFMCSEAVAIYTSTWADTLWRVLRGRGKRRALTGQRLTLYHY